MLIEISKKTRSLFSVQFLHKYLVTGGFPLYHTCYYLVTETKHEGLKEKKYVISLHCTHCGKKLVKAKVNKKGCQKGVKKALLENIDIFCNLSKLRYDRNGINTVQS